MIFVLMFIGMATFWSYILFMKWWVRGSEGYTWACDVNTSSYASTYDKYIITVYYNDVKADSKTVRSNKRAGWVAADMMRAHTRQQAHMRRQT